MRQQPFLFQSLLMKGALPRLLSGFLVFTLCCMLPHREDWRRCNAIGCLEYRGLATPEQGNVFQTIDDVRHNLALRPDWGPRDAFSGAKVPKGAEVEFFKGGTARQQVNGVIFEGGGLQYRFKDFNESRIIDTRKIPGAGNE